MKQNKQPVKLKVLSTALEGRTKCPQCRGSDIFCTLCDGNFTVSQIQAREYRVQYPEAL